MSIQATGDGYDFLRRRGSVMNERSGSVSGSISPRRKPIRQQSTRNSQGTLNSVMSSSTAQRSEETNITLPPAFSKKFVVVGDGGCGKTCFLISYANRKFPEKYVPTVFENYICHKEHGPDKKTLELALWDTAGQEEYDRLRPLSYPETDLLFVCFAIDCPNSLENVMDKWYPEVLHFCPTTPLILLGLKSDLRTKRNCIDLLKTQGLTPVTPEQGQDVARRMGAIYRECSSKEMHGVDEVFEFAIDTVIAQQTEIETELKQQQIDSRIPAKKSKKAKNRSCKML